MASSPIIPTGPEPEARSTRLRSRRYHSFLFAYFFAAMKYDVYGLGNAIVDIVTEVGHDFFEKNE